MAQTTNSQPNPKYTFTVNLQTLQWGSWVQPNNNLETPTGDGGTFVEVNDQRNHRTIWLPCAFPGTSLERSPEQGDVGTSGHGSQKGYYRHGDTVVAYGANGKYLKDTYVSNPARPDDVLIFVSAEYV